MIWCRLSEKRFSAKESARKSTTAKSKAAKEKVVETEKFYNSKKKTDYRNWRNCLLIRFYCLCLMVNHDADMCIYGSPSLSKNTFAKKPFVDLPPYRIHYIGNIDKRKCRLLF
jgi:hypothetical protein